MPPCISSSASLPSRARAPNSAICVSISARTELIGVAQHRHDQAALGADGDADVVVVLVDDVLAVDLGIDRGDLLQRLHAGLDEEAHDAELDAVLLLEGFAIVRLSCITALISTSLNVVSMAAVSCASFSRLAMVWRSRVMRTRSSREASSGASGARGAGGGFGFGSRRNSAAAALAMLVTGAAGRLREHVRLQHLAAAARALHVVRA